MWRVLQLEGKLRKALSEVESRERQLKAREESWRSDHAQKLSELQLLQRRLKEETKHQVQYTGTTKRSTENRSNGIPASLLLTGYVSPFAFQEVNSERTRDAIPC